MIHGAEQLDELLGELAGALDLEDSDKYELLVCGGAALNALGIVIRTTLDVDVVALVRDGDDHMAKPLPEPLHRAAERVARARGIPSDWLNAEPGDMQRYGLPSGIVARSQSREYGSRLLVRFIDRYDQIHFKLFALVDQGSGKHLADFAALNPTVDEIRAAARWCMTQDPSPGFRAVLLEAVMKLGWRDVSDEYGESDL